MLSCNLLPHDMNEIYLKTNWIQSQSSLSLLQQQPLKSSFHFNVSHVLHLLYKQSSLLSSLYQHHLNTELCDLSKSTLHCYSQSSYNMLSLDLHQFHVDEEYMRQQSSIDLLHSNHLSFMTFFYTLLYMSDHWCLQVLAYHSQFEVHQMNEVFHSHSVTAHHNSMQTSSFSQLDLSWSYAGHLKAEDIIENSFIFKKKQVQTTQIQHISENDS